MFNTLMKFTTWITLCAFAPIALGQDTQPATVPSTPPATTLETTPATMPVATSVPFSPVPHVEVRGKGPIQMVLIPGLLSDWTVFESFMERNGERYTMYAVTL